MAKIYFNRLISGTILFENIPAKYKDAVYSYGQEWLDAGKITEERFRELFGQNAG